MALVQCPFGHYYDDVRNDKCPVCKKNSNGEGNFGIQSQVTVSGYKLGESSEGLTQLLGEDSFPSFEEKRNAASMPEPTYDAMSDENSTIGIFALAGTDSYTAGWLVAADGPCKGQSFTAVMGRNRCGRGLTNDICIADPSVTSDMHCSLIYEPKVNRFFLSPENGVVYCNGKFINSPIELKSGDSIHIGNTDLIFVPYCTEERSWQE